MVWLLFLSLTIIKGSHFRRLLTEQPPSSGNNTGPFSFSAINLWLGETRRKVNPILKPYLPLALFEGDGERIQTYWYIKHHQTFSAFVFSPPPGYHRLWKRGSRPTKNVTSPNLTAEVTFDWSTLEKPVLDGILRRLFNQLDKDGNGEVPLRETWKAVLFTRKKQQERYDFSQEACYINSPSFANW